MPKRAKRDCDENPLENGCYAVDLNYLARDCMRRFLSGRKMVSGKRITEEDLFTVENIKLLLRTPFDDPTFRFIHERCLPVIPVRAAYTRKSVPWTVFCLIRILKRMQQLAIPKEFQPGLLLLYFKLCKGINQSEALS